MIENIVKDMSDLVDQLKSSINQDILDIKEAKHEELLKRNDQKHQMIDEIMALKMELNISRFFAIWKLRLSPLLNPQKQTAPATISKATIQRIFKILLIIMIMC